MASAELRSGCDSLYTLALDCLLEPDPATKVARTRKVHADWHAGRLYGDGPPPEPIGEPGRPARPRLVHPRQVPQRGTATVAGRAALLHAIAHIEFNAINLALDAVYRFREMPRAYCQDWIGVAAEEALHFEMVCTRLQALGYRYGDFDAHDGLWEMARRTAGDPLLRMALVPRVLEARGLDVTPAMIGRLQQAGDDESVAVLERILRDEEGHVAIGSRWFEYICRQRGLEPVPTFRSLLQRHLERPPRGPFNRPARLRAGFSEAELAVLEQDARGEPRR